MKTSSILFGIIGFILIGGCKVKKAFLQASELNTPQSFNIFLEKYPKGRFSDRARWELRIIDEAADWERIKFSQDIQKFNEFLGTYPNGIHAKDAIVQIIELKKILNAWTQTQLLNTIIDYEYFLDLYPNSSYAPLASKGIKSIKDKRAWEDALIENTTDAYQTYLSLFPNGENTQDAIARIEEIEKILPEWAETVEDNSAYSYRSFLAKYPYSSLAVEAQRRLNDIESWLWRDAEKKNTVASYERYLRVFPSGQYVVKADLRIFEMKVVQPEWNLVVEANTIPGYKGFIQKFPESQYYREALSRLKELEDTERREQELIQRFEQERKRKEREAEQERRRQEAVLAAERQLKIDYEKYKNYSLPTGAMPYSNCFGKNNACLKNGCSEITVIAPKEIDVLVTIKKENRVIRHAYIQGNSSFTFHLENGSYQPFFYFGEGWYPQKLMNSLNCNSLRGGFLRGEDISKDDPQSLYNNILTYTLIYQRDGNFQTKPSNELEAF